MLSAKRSHSRNLVEVVVINSSLDMVFWGPRGRTLATIGSSPLASVDLGHKKILRFCRGKHKYHQVREAGDLGCVVEKVLRTI